MSTSWRKLIDAWMVDVTVRCMRVATRCGRYARRPDDGPVFAIGGGA